MRSWSWMTAGLAMMALGATPALPAQDEPAVNQVALTLQISGLGSEGGVLEIRPAHAGCQFAPVARTLPKVPPNRVVKTDTPIVFAVTSRSADRDCSFAITIREPNKPPKTYLRGLRLNPVVAGEAPKPQTLRCYLSSPTLAARNERAAARR